MPHLAFEQKVTSMKKISIVVTIVAVLLAAVMLLYGCTFRVQCAEGSKMCGDGNILKTCVKLGENNNAWVQSEDCAAAGNICDGQTKTCAAGCTYSYIDQTGVARSMGFAEGATGCIDANTAAACQSGVIAQTNCVANNQACVDGACTSGGCVYNYIDSTGVAQKMAFPDGATGCVDSVRLGSCQAGSVAIIDCNAQGGVCEGSQCTTSNVGTVSISSNQADSLVYIDGQYTGTTLASEVLIPGTHDVKVLKTGFNEFQTTVDVVEGIPAAVDATLTAVTGTGTLSISPTPFTGSVNTYFYLDGSATFSAQTTQPVSLSVAAGTHTVRITRGGVRDYLGSVTVPVGGTAALTPILIPLNAGNGNLYVFPTLPGAEVFVNDAPTPVGVAPLSVELAAGTYKLRVSKAGFKDYLFSIYISSGSTATVSPTVTALAADQGNLYISPTPFTGSVNTYFYLDGSAAISAQTIQPVSLSVAAGTHTVRITRTGYQVYNTPTSIQVIDGQTTPLIVALTPNP